MLLLWWSTRGTFMCLSTGPPPHSQTIGSTNMIWVFYDLFKSWWPLPPHLRYWITIFMLFINMMVLWLFRMLFLKSWWPISLWQYSICILWPFKNLGDPPLLEWVTIFILIINHKKKIKFLLLVLWLLRMAYLNLGSESPKTPSRSDL